jgi:D-aminoacyl-tRNA deacylase
MQILNLFATLSFRVILLLFQISAMSAFTSPAAHTLARTLLVATTKDVASLNIANAVSSKTGMWQQISDGLYKSARLNSVLWVQNESLLGLDNPHRIVPLSETEKSALEEVLFLSRHSAASGVASLTVHPIGVAWLNDEECAQYGGKGGKCSPPSMRIGRIYRNLLAETKKRGLEKTFEVTMEATHHGPYSELPTCFIEIGSCDKTWPNQDAAAVWADLLEEELQQPEGETAAPGEGNGSTNDDGSIVVALLGGGHYIPKMNDCARLGENVYVGHSIASYALQALLLQEEGNDDSAAAITWKSVVLECIESTLSAHPARQLVVLIDKKAFKAAGRARLMGLLDGMGIPYAWSVSDVKKIYEARQQSASAVAASSVSEKVGS